MNQKPYKTTPKRCIATWLLSALAAATGLAMDYGFPEPPVTDNTIRIILLTALGLFLLSRLLMSVPVSGLGTRLRRWWVDFVLIIAAVPWYIFDPSREPVILRIAAVYCLIIGAGAIAKAGIRALTEDWSEQNIRSAGRRLLIGAVICVLIGSIVLALPICWAHTYPLSGDAVYDGQIRHVLGMHWLDCLFTATAALTCTGLAVLDIGYKFSRVGQLVIIIMMQIGGLAILTIGAAVGWRLRDYSPVGLRRLIRFVFIMTFFIEAMGALAVYDTWNPDPKIDYNFNVAQKATPIFGDFFEDEARIVASAFHAVSAFCNIGMTLPRDSMTAYHGHLSLYTILLPLMVIGSIGGPVIYELWCRLIYRSSRKQKLSKDSKITLGATIGLIVIGMGLIWAVESTQQWQHRYLKTNVPGRIQLPTTTQANNPSTTQAIAANDAKTETQPWLTSLFHSVSARSCGMRVTRLDAHSISPASHMILRALMLIGGGVGGATGGLRIIIVALLIGALFARRRPVASQAVALATAMAVALAMVLVLTAFALTYREAEPLDACIFEALSACCNVGLTTGMTPLLSVQGKVILVLGMLLGRIVPVIILFRCMCQPTPQPITEPAIPVTKLKNESYEKEKPNEESYPQKTIEFPDDKMGPD
ncbi:MAG: potassium transporter TrkG [Planctomycetota bacterium]|jgi:trk system potassium uptake protein TrkH